AMEPLSRRPRRFFCSSPRVKAGVKKCCTLDSLKRTNNFVSTAYAGDWTTGFIAPTARTTGLTGQRPGSNQPSPEIRLRWVVVIFALNRIRGNSIYSQDPRNL